MGGEEKSAPLTLAARAATNAAAVPRSLADFLESSSPDVIDRVSTLLERRPNGTTYFCTPDLSLHCDSVLCNGIRVFHCSDSHYLSSSYEYIFARYICRNCGSTVKTFSLAVLKDKEGTSGRVRKLGEDPTFGPPIPARVITLVGSDRELFLRGRRAELHGLGIGAFAYYRRVVEDKKGKIIEEIGKVAAKLGASPETLKLFAEAESETQFSKAIDKIKAAIPESLLIDGHNPLTLLHSALSEGLHEKTDEECLELATSIRVVLIDLAERISSALKEDATLKTAVKRLLNRQLT